MRTEGARLLSATGLDHSAIASEVGVTRQAVQQWVAGDKTPGVARRGAILERYGVPVEAWDRPAEAPKAEVEGTSGGSGEGSMSEGTSTGTGRRFDAESRLRSQLARLDKLRADGEAEGGDLPPQARLRLEVTETRCTELLARLTGEGQEIGESRIVRLPAWRRIQDAIVVALRPYPEAAVAVMKALKEVGA